MSAGGIGPLRQIIRALSPGFPAALVIAHHSGAESHLTELIRCWCVHPAQSAEAGTVLQGGTIYVNPPAHHIVVHPDATLSAPARGRVRHVRASVDWLFESAAASFRERTIGVVLSGSNADGAYGAGRIQKAGGHVVIQDPAAAAFRQMPRAALVAVGGGETFRDEQLPEAIIRSLAAIDVVRHLRAWEDPFASA